MAADPASSIIAGVLEATAPSEPVPTGGSLGEGAMPGQEPELETAAEAALCEGVRESPPLPALGPS